MKRILLLLLIVLAINASAQMQEADHYYYGFEVVGLDTLYYDTVVGAGDPNMRFINVDFDVDSTWLPGKSKALLIRYNKDTISINRIPANENDGDTLFAKWEEHILNADNTEYRPYCITHMAAYDDPTEDVNDHFGAIVITPTMSIVDASGVGDYLSLAAGIAGISSGDTLIVKGGTYTTPGTYLYITKDCSIIGVGACKYINGNTSYAWLMNGAGTFSGFEIINTTAQYFCLTFNKNIIISNMYIDEGNRIITSSAGNSTLTINKSYFTYSNYTLRDFDVKCKYFNMTDNYVYYTSTSGILYNTTTENQVIKLTCNKFEGLQTGIYNVINIDTLLMIGNDIETTSRFIISLSGKWIENALCYGNNAVFQGFNQQLEDNKCVAKFRNNNFRNSTAYSIIQYKNADIEMFNNTLTTSVGTLFTLRSDSIVNCNIQNNYFHVTGAGYGVSIGDYMYNNTITTNFISNKIVYDVIGNVHGLQIYNMDNSTVRYNYVKNTELIFKGDGHNFSNSDMSYNIIEDGGILLKGVDSTNVYNNTIYSTNNPYPCIYLMKNNGSCFGNTLENNILYKGNSGDGLPPLYEHTDSISYTSNYNVIYSNNDTIACMYNQQYKIWSEWQALGNDANSINTDPLFVDEYNSDFSLQQNSPAIDAGINLGETYKYGLHPASIIPYSIELVEQGEFWDMGARINPEPIKIPYTVQYKGTQFNYNYNNTYTVRY